MERSWLHGTVGGGGGRGAVHSSIAGARATGVREDDVGVDAGCPDVAVSTPFCVCRAVLL